MHRRWDCFLCELTRGYVAHVRVRKILQTQHNCSTFPTVLSFINDRYTCIGQLGNLNHITRSISHCKRFITCHMNSLKWSNFCWCKDLYVRQLCCFQCLGSLWNGKKVAGLHCGLNALSSVSQVCHLSRLSISVIISAQRLILSIK